MMTAPVSPPTEDVMTALAALGQASDDPGKLAEGALLLASLSHPGLSLERYHHHLDKLGRETGARFTELRAAGADDSAGTRLAALKHVMVDRHDYFHDREAPDHIQNDNLIRVIDRGKGGAMALAVLYLVAGLAQGWDIALLALPAYPVLRLAHGAERVLCDPADGCLPLQAADLRRLVKTHAGPQAELAADYYEPLAWRDILIRLHNPVKLYQIACEDYAASLQSVEALRALAPDEYRLLLDAGVLYARLGRDDEAEAALEGYISAAPDPRDRREAALLLQEIRFSPDKGTD